jgi:hypothetical protein
MSANEVLEQVKALPPDERRKFFDCVRELEATIEAQPNGKRKRRVRWPDAAGAGTGTLLRAHECLRGHQQSDYSQ